MMRRIQQLALAGICVCLCAMSAQAELRVEVSGVSSAKGYVRGLVFSSKRGFPEDRSKAAAEFSIPAKEAKNGKILLSLPEVKGGKGVVVTFHDLDGSGTMKKSMFGIPKEPVAMSNWNGKGRPDFDKCAGPLTGTIRVKLMNL